MVSLYFRPKIEARGVFQLWKNETKLSGQILKVIDLWALPSPRFVLFLTVTHQFQTLKPRVYVLLALRLPFFSPHVRLGHVNNVMFFP